jgi:hypothetical protein
MYKENIKREFDQILEKSHGGGKAYKVKDNHVKYDGMEIE